jgi:hypothetical protein
MSIVSKPSSGASTSVFYISAPRGPLDPYEGRLVPRRAFATLPEVINYYNAHFKLELTEKEIDDLAHYLKSL